MLVNSSIDSLVSVHSLCSNSTFEVSIFTPFFTTRLVILIPVCIFILHLGIQQWRQHSSLKTASHSDIFTYNLAVMELMWCLGTLLYFWGVFSYFLVRVTLTYFLTSIIYFGETSFQVLTCVDRYLAVVHPVMYRKLRNVRAVTIRNISIFCIWILLFLLAIMSSLGNYVLSMTLFFTFFAISQVVVSFCSLSVLFVLFRPGPGAGGGNKGRVDPSKQRAFFTVMAIMGVQSLFFSGFLNSTAVVLFSRLCDSVKFQIFSILIWLCLPSSLVSPLLYLHKAGKLPCGHQGGRSRE